MNDSLSPRIRVIKVGGSLLDLADLKGRFDQWLDAQSPTTNLLICGGGAFVDVLRRLDQTHCFGHSTVHWMAVELMHDTARLLARLLDRPLIATQDELRTLASEQSIAPDDAGPDNREPDSMSAQRVYVIEPTAYYSRQLSALDGNPLPESWDCTSDSIAAYLARRLQAADLVLFKSTKLLGHDELTVNSSILQQLVSDGIIDKVFPTIGTTLPQVRCVNLRSD